MARIAVEVQLVRDASGGSVTPEAFCVWDAACGLGMCAVVLQLLELHTTPAVLPTSSPLFK